MKTTCYILVRPLSETWEFKEINSKYKSSDTWKRVESGAVMLSQLENLKSQKELKVIVLPAAGTIEDSSFDQIILVSKGDKSLLSGLYPEQENQFWEVQEEINRNGDIIVALTEPEINKALRTIFRHRTKEVIFLLSNALFNPVHQSNMKNVLHTAGVRSIIQVIK